MTTTEPRQLAPGAWRIATTSRDAAFLVEGEDGLTLIDVGWASAYRPLLGAIEHLGRKPADVKRIVLTHAHPDLAAAPDLRATSLRALPQNLTAVGFAHGPALTRADELDAFQARLEAVAR